MHRSSSPSRACDSRLPRPQPANAPNKRKKKKGEKSRGRAGEAFQDHRMLILPDRWRPTSTKKKKKGGEKKRSRGLQPG